MSLICQSRWENFIQALSSPLSFRVWNSKQWLGCWGCGSLLSCLHSEWLSPERAAAQEPSAGLVPRASSGPRKTPSGPSSLANDSRALTGLVQWESLVASYLPSLRWRPGRQSQGQGGVSTVPEHQGTREQLCSAPARTNNYSGLQVHQGGTRHSGLASDWSNVGPGGVWLAGAGVVWTEAQVQASSGFWSSGPERHGHSHKSHILTSNLLTKYKSSTIYFTLAFYSNVALHCIVTTKIQCLFLLEILITEIVLLSLSLGWENSMSTDFKGKLHPFNMAAVENQKPCWPECECLPDCACLALWLHQVLTIILWHVIVTYENGQGGFFHFLICGFNVVLIQIRLLVCLTPMI